ncbi:alpha/beta fold hydrolase [Micromonospora krabiensis]|uniref:Pimeloyl-ACP methyl ester carboxylesterase n=1 Tax=Micromonospora krabiensis TaxID=307121 RepID=A0A1C3N1C8_9ACTN|nr:alpha/beta hydrolase [Micromonospora krabiensis]SBV26361.1 Pimeloyl-ACP methyl ester carboxylesterase [Micromonospora krabiensis]
MTAGPDRPLVVLVHGAWHRPSTWDAARSALAALGYETRVVALPSAGRDPAPTASMYDDAAVIRKELDQVDGPAVVVAHSYAGIPTSEGLTGATNVAHLIYLAAYLLDDGESMYSRHGMDVPADTTGLFPLMGSPGEALYHDVPRDVAARAVEDLVDQSLLSFTGTVTRAAWHDIPSTYVVCDDDRTIPPALQETMAAHATATRRWPGGHSPFLADPQRFAALVDDIIRSR